jgi:DNA-binding MarR family transcriptional regulator
MSIFDEAARLESLLPHSIAALFWSREEDPLRNHSVGQVRMMRALSGGPKTASDLSHILGISPSSLTQMASRMILAGLVSKELDECDRRVRKLSLTSQGQSLMEGRKAMRARAAIQLLERMEPAHREQLIQLLEEIGRLAADEIWSPLEAVV